MTDKAQLLRILRKYPRLLDTLTDLFEEHNVPPAEGEVILLWLAGLSAGYRQAPIDESGGWIRPAVLGWQFAAAHGDDYDDID